MKTLDDLLRAKGLYATCPSCTESFPLRKAALFDATKSLPAYARNRLDQEVEAIADGQRQLRAQRDQLHQRSFTSAASSGVGQTLEMVAASLPGLPMAARDCRSLLKPVDYLAFEGATAGKVHAIRFIEVKTGRNRLSDVQRSIKLAVDGGAVKLRIANHRLTVK